MSKTNPLLSVSKNIPIQAIPPVSGSLDVDIVVVVVVDVVVAVAVVVVVFVARKEMDNSDSLCFIFIVKLTCEEAFVPATSRFEVGI